jgi:hypothetical protein
MTRTPESREGDSTFFGGVSASSSGSPVPAAPLSYLDGAARPVITRPVAGNAAREESEMEQGKSVGHKEADAGREEGASADDEHEFGQREIDFLHACLRCRELLLAIGVSGSKMAG